MLKTIDDSYINTVGATKFGWKEVAHFVEPQDKPPKTAASKHLIRDLEELRTLFPEFFKGQS